MRITLILGSIRANRQSHKPALFIRKRLEEAGYQVDYLDVKELKLPLFDDSPEQMNSQSVLQLKESIKTAEAIVLVFPEYNHDMSATMRNTLAFLRNREFMHLPVGLVAVSNGLIGGNRALYAAKASLPTLGGVILPTVVSIPVVQDTFPDENSCTSKIVSDNIERFMKELSVYAPALTEVRKQLTA